jgi:hypothetical protein
MATMGVKECLTLILASSMFITEIYAASYASMGSSVPGRTGRERFPVPGGVNAEGNTYMGGAKGHNTAGSRADER